MTKDETINKLVDLYKATTKTKRDKDNFEEIAKHISDIHNTEGVIKLLDEYERYFIVLLNSMPVTVLAKLCGLSRMQTYRLLETKSRLHIFKKFYSKNEANVTHL